MVKEVSQEESKVRKSRKSVVEQVKQVNRGRDSILKKRMDDREKFGGVKKEITNRQKIW
jgi:hypothetical protein